MNPHPNLTPPTGAAHRKAALLAFLVTTLWASSWVLIKIGLQDLPALYFAGLRDLLAFLMLLPFSLRGAHLRSLRTLDRGGWLELALFGLLQYTITQGALFVSLVYLPATSANLLLSFTPALVALLGMGLLGERPTLLQWLGTALFLGSVWLFLGAGRGGAAAPPVAGAWVGYLAVLVGVVGNTLATLLGRRVNRRGTLTPVAVTAASIGIGSIVLFALGAGLEGLPPLSGRDLLIILWLAGVNSAFAFTLWNFTQRSLPAFESSLINNTMLFQVALLAWIFLGEALTGLQLVALLLAALGTLLVQLRRNKTRNPAA